MSTSYPQNVGNAITLPSQKLLLSLSLEDLAKFLSGLDMEELLELLQFYEAREYFEACIVVRNYIKYENKKIAEQRDLILC